MASTKRATIYLDSDLHRAIKVKSAETETSISDLVNTVLRRSLVEDADDLTSIRARRKEPVVAFETLVNDLRRRGKL
jgi:hypothetical protein